MYRKPTGGQGEDFRIKTPMQGEMFAIVESRLGTNKLSVLCEDQKIRIARIPGKFKKRLWIHENDVLIVKPWDITGEKFCDVVFRYTAAQVGNLRRKGLLIMDV